MELYVKMTDEEYEEYKDYIKNKEEYVKKSDITIHDIVKRDFDYVRTDYYAAYDIKEVVFKSKDSKQEIFIRELNYSKGDKI